MKTLVLFLSLLLLNGSISAQDTWNDYVIGRPMAGYYDAKKVVAKEWGIHYKVTFAGCVLSDEISDQAAAYQKSNKAYFETLATKYGENWKENFELDVKKTMYRNSSIEKGTWYEIIGGNKNKAFYAAKKEIAKTWGISYEAQFVSKGTPNSKQVAFIERLVANDDYVNQLENTFGQNWQEKLNQEVETFLEKSSAVHSKNVWIDYIFGKTSMLYFDIKKDLAKEWGINYESSLKGCILTPKMEKEAAKVEKANARYFKILEQKHGKDWKIRFDKEVTKRAAEATK